MNRKKKFNPPPRWITAKHGNCPLCGQAMAGKPAAWWPRTRIVYCATCGGDNLNDCLKVMKERNNKRRATR